MKAIFSNITLEVTRGCNLQCGHCLRGDAENVYMSKKVIDELSKHGIQILFLSGGEPLLKPEIISYAANKLTYENFEMITNGMWYNENLNDDLNNSISKCLLDLHNHALDLYNKDQLSYIKFSLTNFHMEQGGTYSNTVSAIDYINKLYSYNGINFEASFYSYMGYLTKGFGKAIENNLSPEIKFIPNRHCDTMFDWDIEAIDRYLDEKIIWFPLYISYNGDLFTCFNLSYDLMRKGTCKIGSIFNMEEAFNNLKEYVNKRGNL